MPDVVRTGTSTAHREAIRVQTMSIRWELERGDVRMFFIAGDTLEEAARSSPTEKEKESLFCYPSSSVVYRACMYFTWLLLVFPP